MQFDSSYNKLEYIKELKDYGFFRPYIRQARN